MKKTLSLTTFENELSKQRTEWSKPVTVTIELTKLDLATLKRRFERMQKKYPHPSNPTLTTEWIVKMCVLESKSLETKHLIKKIKSVKV